MKDLGLALSALALLAVLAGFNAHRDAQEAAEDYASDLQAEQAQK